MMKLWIPCAVLPLLASCVAPRTGGSAPVAAAAPPAGTARDGPPATPMTSGRYTGDWSVADIGSEEWRYTPAAAGGNSIGGGARGAGASGRDAAGATGESAVLMADAGVTLARLSCANGAISLSRPRTAGNGVSNSASNVGGNGISIRTSFAERSLAARDDNSNNTLVATLDARDPLWDQIIYSRGRFLIETAGMPPLIAPVRPEIARLVEDCRG